MPWKIYQDRNGWLAGQSVGEAPNRALAQALAAALDANHIANGREVFYWSSGKWRKA